MDVHQIDKTVLKNGIRILTRKMPHTRSVSMGVWVNVGARDEGGGLLGRALQFMLAAQHRYQRGTALDVWAFGEVYRQWLHELRELDADWLRDKHIAYWGDIDTHGFAILYQFERQHWPLASHITDQLDLFL